jgi:glycosidase
MPRNQDRRRECNTPLIGGHDKHRISCKLGQKQSSILAMLLKTLRGTPFLFAGDEMGAEQVEIPPDKILDESRCITLQCLGGRQRRHDR